MRWPLASGDGARDRIAAALALAFAALSASEAGGEERYSAGPMAGTTLGGVTEPSETVWGGRVAARLRGNVSLELAALRFTDHPTEERLGITVDTALGITSVHLSGRYRHPAEGGRLSGYVLAGIGCSFNDDSDFTVRGLAPGGPVVQTGALEVDRENALGWQAGAGLEWPLWGSLSASVEYRYAVMWNDATITGLAASRPEGEDAIAAFEKDFWDNNELGILSVGVSWRF